MLSLPRSLAPRTASRASRPRRTAAWAPAPGPASRRPSAAPAPRAPLPPRRSAGCRSLSVSAIRSVSDGEPASARLWTPTDGPPRPRGGRGGVRVPGGTPTCERRCRPAPPAGRGCAARGRRSGRRGGGVRAVAPRARRRRRCRRPCPLAPARSRRRARRSRREPATGSRLKYRSWDRYLSLF